MYNQAEDHARWEDSGKPNLHLCNYMGRNSCPLFQRGWVIQEQVLAIRGPIIRGEIAHLEMSRWRLQWKFAELPEASQCYQELGTSQYNKWRYFPQVPIRQIYFVSGCWKETQCQTPLLGNAIVILISSIRCQKPQSEIVDSDGWHSSCSGQPCQHHSYETRAAAIDSVFEKKTCK